jgi:hypothetical protein
MRKFRYWIGAVDVDDAVVVTHHAPSRLSIAPEFADSPLNAFYYDPFGEAILGGCNKPQLWIHGHTHAGCDYVHDLGGVRVVSNPVGYVFEPSKTFNPESRRGGELTVHDYRWFEIQIQKMHVCEEDGFYSTADNIKRRLVHYARRRQS